MFKLARTWSRTLGQVKWTGIGNANVVTEGKSCAFFSTTPTAFDKIEVNGVNLYYEKHGRGDHVALLCPGLVGSFQLNFAPIVEKMDKTAYHLVGWDPPGYGRSRPPKRNVFTKEFVLESDAEFGAELMEKLGYQKYSVIGYSNGGVTAAIIAGKYRDRIRKLVMCNAPSGFSGSSNKIMTVMSDLDYWSPEQRSALIHEYGQPYLEEMLRDWKKLTDEFTKEQTKELKARLAKYVTGLEIPALYIQGARDTIIPETDAEDYADWIPYFNYHRWPDGGHDHLEFVDQFVKVTQNFLSLPIYPKDKDEIDISNLK